MKRTVLILAVVLVLVLSTASWAQMGGGMMGGQQGGMMQEQGMMGGMMQMMNQMAGMMQRISGMMREGMGPDDVKAMSEIMSDLAAHMKEMSWMFEKGDISQQEMNALQQKMMETEQRLQMMK